MRRERRSAWGMIGAGIMILLASIAVFSSPASAAWVQTVTPTPGARVLFQDDFATYSNRWPESSSPKASVAYHDAALNMRVVSPGVSTWSLPDFATTLDRYSIQVVVDFHEGSLDSLAGFILGYQDDENFYALMMSPEGEWRYVQRDGKDWIDLTPPQAISWTVGTGETIFRLRADVTAEQIVLSIDDSPIGTVPLTSELAVGKFGLIARAGHGYVDVLFDDVVVTDIAE